MYIARVGKSVHGGPCGPGLCDKNTPTSAFDELLEPSIIEGRNNDSAGGDERRGNRSVGTSGYSDEYDAEMMDDEEDAGSNAASRRSTTSGGDAEGRFQDADDVWGDDDYDDEDDEEEGILSGGNLRDGRRYRNRGPFGNMEERNADYRERRMQRNQPAKKKARSEQ